MAVSSGDVLRRAATSARVLPVRCFSAGFLKPNSSTRSGEPAASSRFSHSSLGVRISAATPCANPRITHPRDPLLQAPFLHPGGHRAIEPGRAGRVHVHVGRDPRAGGAGGFDHLDRARTLRPVVPAGRFQVIDLGRQPWPRGRCGSARRPLRPAGCLRCACARCTCPGIRPATLHSSISSLRVGIKSRRVNQRRADAQRALFHRLRAPDRAFVPVRRARGAGLRSPARECAPSSRRRTRPRCTTRRGATRYSKYSPSVVQGIVYLMSPWRSAMSFFMRGVQRAHRPAFAEHFERHALADIALRAAIVQERDRGPGEHVDEARRHGQTAARRYRDWLAQCRRSPTAATRSPEMRHVADAWSGAGAIIDRAAPQNDVELRSDLRCVGGRLLPQTRRPREPVHHKARQARARARPTRGRANEAC